MGRQDTVDLTPRAVAVLVALRSSPRHMNWLRNAIGDSRTDDTAALLKVMSEYMDCGASSCEAMLGQVPGDKRYYLTHEGVGWLEAYGLAVVQESRLLFAQEAKAAAP